MARRFLVTIVGFAFSCAAAKTVQLLHSMLSAALLAMLKDHS